MCWILLGIWMAWADIYRDKQGDIPESFPDRDAYLEELDIPADISNKPVSDTYDWDAGFTLKIPGFYRAEPAVLEANRIVQGKEHRAITDGRVVR